MRSTKPLPSVRIGSVLLLLFLVIASCDSTDLDDRGGASPPSVPGGQAVLTGVVRNSLDEPIPWAVVEVEGTVAAVDDEGAFTVSGLSGFPPTATVRAEYYEVASFSIEPIGLATGHTFVLKAAPIQERVGLAINQEWGGEMGLFNRVAIRWDSSGAPTLAGYSVLRRGPDGTTSVLAAGIEPDGRREIIDERLEPGEHIYQVWATNIDGSETEFAGPARAVSERIRFVRIEAGSFFRGSDKGESGETPVREVTISRPFWLGEVELTLGQHVAVTGQEVGYLRAGLRKPVNRVTWFQAIEFLNTLSSKEGLPPCYGPDGGVLTQNIYRCPGYRLPTEAEWEYACRAGTTTEWWWGEDGEARLDYIANPWVSGYPDVGSMPPNPWGVFDMIGSTWEWVNDRYLGSYYEWGPSLDPPGPRSGSKRTERGGGASTYDPKYLRCASRWPRLPAVLGSNGFRVARTVSPE
ncbi:MAG: sulfatase activating formylglycine-generating enzyme [Rhodothermales bacterium]